MILWDMKDGFPIRSANIHAEKAQSRFSLRTGVLDIAMAPDGVFLTVGRDRGLRRWRPDGGGHGNVNDLTELPTRLALIAESQVAVIGDSKGTLTIWDLKNLKVVQKLP